METLISARGTVVCKLSYRPKKTSTSFWVFFNLVKYLFLSLLVFSLKHIPVYNLLKVVPPKKGVWRAA